MSVDAVSNFITENSTVQSNTVEDESVETVFFVAYIVVLPIILVIGICGNILNLITLRSHSLQSIPFMYIRAIAVFDLIALPLIGGFCFEMSLFFRNHIKSHLPYFLAVYFAFLQFPLINSMFVASLFTAIILTVERYRSATISQFHRLRLIQFKQKAKAKVLIFGAFGISSVLHWATLAFEYEVTCTPETDWYNCTYKENDFQLKIELYTMREVVCRILPVLVLAVWNAVLVRKLQQIKKRRNLLKLRQTNLNQLEKTRSRLNSFTERRLTTMMVGITLIYVVGNIPQSISMIYEAEGLAKNLSFQIFRSFANVTEISNHCLNFYIFCLTSGDYSKTFMRRCRRMQQRFWEIFAPERVRRESVDTQSTTCQTPGEQSVFLLEGDDDLIPL